MKCLVFGATGQVGQALLGLAEPGLTFEPVPRDRADLADPAACAAVIAASAADLVINAAAWTAVDAAEDAPQEAAVINRDAPIAMARACAERGVPFVHLSSDYVLAGQGTDPQPEDTPLDPLSVYGRTKAEAETGIAAEMAPGRFAILRTSWVFSATGSNFVRTMLRLAETRQVLSVVGDQVGGPTSASSIARACVTLGRALVADTARGGVYNFAGAPETSWADFARAILEVAGFPTRVVTIRTEDYPTRAARPANSRLDCGRIAAEFGLPRPQWRDDLPEVVAALGVSA